MTNPLRSVDVSDPSWQLHPEVHPMTVGTLLDAMMDLGSAAEGESMMIVEFGDFSTCADRESFSEAGAWVVSVFGRRNNA